jgi:hypothetical protein
MKALKLSAAMLPICRLELHVNPELFGHELAILGFDLMVVEDTDTGARGRIRSEGAITNVTATSIQARQL